jgi:hypothetical protein
VGKDERSLFATICNLLERGTAHGLLISLLDVFCGYWQQELTARGTGGGDEIITVAQYVLLCSYYLTCIFVFMSLYSKCNTYSL